MTPADEAHFIALWQQTVPVSQAEDRRCAHSAFVPLSLSRSRPLEWWLGSWGAVAAAADCEVPTFLETGKSYEMRGEDGDGGREGDRSRPTDVLDQRGLPDLTRGGTATGGIRHRCFSGLKEVGMAVRQVGRFGPTDLGIDLIRKAFEAKGGPLTDPSAPMLEREALAHLFAEAIGSYKNPHSHRNVPITAKEAAEMVMPASHLLRIVDSHAGAS
jgi:Protein of unknown function (Hypoth_ymh)